MAEPNKTTPKTTANPAAKPASAKASADKKAPAKTAAKKDAPKLTSAERARGKKYREAAGKLEAGKQYELAEAIDLVKKTSTSKFDGSVEVHLRLGIDARQAEQSVRGTVKLPAGTGKTLKVMAFVPAAKQVAAKKAGADFVSDEATLKKIAGGWTGFDVAVATPDQMAEVGKLGKTLGPKGLMPNPKSGTVGDEVSTMIESVKKGTIEFRVAQDATIHAGVGKVSFKPEDLVANVAAYYQAVQAAKPDDAKGTYIRSITLAATMGPGIRVDQSTLRKAAKQEAAA